MGTMSDENCYVDYWGAGTADGTSLDRAGLWSRHVAIVQFHAGAEDMGALGDVARAAGCSDDLARAALKIAVVLSLSKGGSVRKPCFDKLSTAV